MGHIQEQDSAIEYWHPASEPGPPSIEVSSILFFLFSPIITVAKHQSCLRRGRGGNLVPFAGNGCLAIRRALLRVWLSGLLDGALAGVWSGGPTAS